MAETAAASKAQDAKPENFMMRTKKKGTKHNMYRKNKFHNVKSVERCRISINLQKTDADGDHLYVGKPRSITIYPAYSTSFSLLI